VCGSIFNSKFILRAWNKLMIWDGNDISVWNERSLNDGSVLVPQNMWEWGVRGSNLGPCIYYAFVPTNWAKLTGMELSNVNLCVSDLMHLDNKTWNTPLIFANFYREIVSKMLILLCITQFWKINELYCTCRK